MWSWVNYYLKRKVAGEDDRLEMVGLCVRKRIAMSKYVAHISLDSRLGGGRGC